MEQEVRDTMLREMVDRMKLSDVWYQNDFAEVLALSNDLPKLFHYKDLIFNAVLAERLKPLPLQVDGFKDPKERNFGFKPADLCSWARAKDLMLPEEFSSIVSVQKEPALHREGNTQKSKSEKALHPKERITFQKMILGMAMDMYKYDPKAKENACTGSNKGSISVSLAEQEFDLDEDTIRKYLKEAADSLL